MSRIGRLPVAIPAGVEVTVAEGNVVTVKGPKGTLERALPTEMEIKVEDGHVVVSRPNDLKKMKSLHGLTRSLIHKMVVGVSEGYTKELEVNGVGYRAQKQGKKLVLSLGYSHPVEMEDPEGLESKVDGNKIIVSGISKDAGIKDVDMLLTSYISDKYLPFILIGYITNITDDGNKLTKSGYLMPVVDFSQIEEVLVITQLIETVEDDTAQ